MEENKGSGSMCENCKNHKMGMCCGHKCCGKHACRVISFIIIIAIAFCVGTMVGRNNDFRERFGGQRFMDRFSDVKENSDNNSTGSVTVDVLPNTTTPPALQ